MACYVLEALVQYMYDYEGEVVQRHTWVNYRCSGIDNGNLTTLLIVYNLNLSTMPGFLPILDAASKTQLQMYQRTTCPSLYD